MPRPRARGELAARSVSAAGLARLVRTGTSLAVICMISPWKSGGSSTARHVTVGRMPACSGAAGARQTRNRMGLGRPARPQPLESRHRHHRGSTPARKAVHIQTRRPDSSRVGLRMNAAGAVRQEQSPLEPRLEPLLPLGNAPLGEEDLLRLVCGIGVAREAWSPFVHHERAAHRAVCLHTQSAVESGLSAGSTANRRAFTATRARPVACMSPTAACSKMCSRIYRRAARLRAATCAARTRHSASRPAGHTPCAPLGLAPRSRFTRMRGHPHGLTRAHRPSYRGGAAARPRGRASTTRARHEPDHKCRVHAHGGGW